MQNEERSCLSCFPIILESTHINGNSMPIEDSFETLGLFTMLRKLDICTEGHEIVRLVYFTTPVKEVISHAWKLSTWSLHWPDVIRWKLLVSAIILFDSWGSISKNLFWSTQIWSTRFQSMSTRRLLWKVRYLLGSISQTKVVVWRQFFHSWNTHNPWLIWPSTISFT